MTLTSPLVAASSNTVIAAAGAVPWRRRRGRLEVALVHRARYDDWAWAKGKLDPDEDWPVAAVREVAEETGLKVRLGRPLPCAQYLVLDRFGEPATKRIRYWAAEVVGGSGQLEHEVDEVAWLDVAAASVRLTYARDQEQLRGIVRADRDGELASRPLVVVRHARARSRGSWSRPDAQRPLDSRGRQRAAALVGLLDAYGVNRLVTSPSVRCADTFAPYAAAKGLRMRMRTGLSEEGYESDPDRAVQHLRRVLSRDHATALCSHGPVLPELLTTLSAASTPAVSGTLLTVAAEGMDKGEALVAHVVGKGSDATVVAVERHRP